MTHRRGAPCTLLAITALAFCSGTAWSAQRDAEKKPSLSLKSNPPVGFSPLNVRIAADIRGGADDDADFYCTSLHWEWGDGTVSESSEDCNPWEAGKSTFRRRFSVTHTYRQPGAYQVILRLKQKQRTVASASSNIQVRGGIRDDDFGS